MPLPLIGGTLLEVVGVGALVRSFGVWALRSIGPLIAKGLSFFGLSIGVQKWLMGPIIGELAQAFSGTDPVFLQVVGYVRGDVAMSLILSAYAVRSLQKVQILKFF